MPLLIFWTCLCITSISALDPGLKLRITQDGLNYANNVAVDLFSKEVKNTRLDDISGEIFGINYKLFNLIIKEFKLHKSTIRLTSENDLEWIATKIDLKVVGAFQYAGYRRFISGNGVFVMMLSDLSSSVGIQIGVDEGGKPTVQTSDCSSDIGKVKIKFYGRGAWFYNILSSLAARTIERLLQNQVCEKVRDLIDGKAEAELCTLRVQMQLGRFLTLDNRLLSAPTITSEYIESNMKGEVFWTQNKTEAPFTAPVMATITDKKKMVYLSLSDYIFNTMAYQAHQHNVLVLNVTSKDIKGKSYFLNTTCSDVCIGKAIPQIGTTYPNSQVELHMKSTEAPVMNISEKRIDVLAAGNITLFARTSDNKLYYLFTVYTILTTSVKVKMMQQRLYASITNTEIRTNVTNSAVGEINENTVQLLAETGIKKIIQPMINGFLGKDGLPLPSLENLQYKDSDCKLLQNTILIETNLKYMSSTINWKSADINYEPKERIYPDSFVV